MDAPELELFFVPAPDDPPLRSSEYQEELRQFENSAQSQRLPIASIVEFGKAAGAESV
jgi:hypothetical protein